MENNARLLDTPEEFDISPLINSVDLYDYTWKKNVDHSEHVSMG